MKYGKLHSIYNGGECLKGKTLDNWVRFGIIGVLVVNLLGVMTGVIDNETFSLIVQLLAGLSLLWTAWREYRKANSFEGMVILFAAIGMILLGQFVFGLF